MRAAITAIEFALPDQVLDNEQLAREFEGWTAEKILAKTGIRERRVARPDQCASDLALMAATRLFERTPCAPGEIDYLLYCTQSPDYFLPSTACVLQHRLGLPTTCGALDFNLGCSGYVYGLGLARALVETGQARKLLLITADTYSKFIHPKDKSVRTLFGDAAAATLVTAVDAETPFIGPFVYGTDGAGAGNLIVPAGGLRQPFVPDAALKTDESDNARTINNLFMDGPEIFNFTVAVVPKVVANLLNAARARLEDIDLFVFHQANRFMLDHLQKRLKVPPERFWVAMDDVGNTVSCTIPVALKKALGAGKIRPGNQLMLVGFGVGYSWGGTLVRWSAAPPSANAALSPPG
jgi:3-oxoacyl-[acyl-carrier-protein] synthase-3